MGESFDCGKFDMNCTCDYSRRLNNKCYDRKFFNLEDPECEEAYAKVEKGNALTEEYCKGKENENPGNDGDSNEKNESSTEDEAPSTNAKQGTETNSASIVEYSVFSTVLVAALMNFLA